MTALLILGGARYWIFWCSVTQEDLNESFISPGEQRQAARVNERI